MNKKSGQITKSPLIQINNLITDSEKNEQEGVRFMLMGFFQGARNIFQHNKVGSGGSDVLSIIIQASYFLNLLDGHSITKFGEWVQTKVDYYDIYQNMPSSIDRLKLRCILRFRKWRYKRISSKTKGVCES